jgi:hypothetical protein
MQRNLQIPKDQLTDFCQRHHIRKLAIFGSAIHEDFRSDSDLDVLVEFETGHTQVWLFLQWKLN